VDIDGLCALAFRLRFEVADRTGAITSHAVPERDQRQSVAVALNQRIEEEPEIVALPDSVIRLRAQPCRQGPRFILILSQYAKGTFEFLTPAQIPKTVYPDLTRTLDSYANVQMWADTEVQFIVHLAS